MLVVWRMTGRCGAEGIVASSTLHLEELQVELTFGVGWHSIVTANYNGLDCMQLQRDRIPVLRYLCTPIDRHRTNLSELRCESGSMK